MFHWLKLCHYRHSGRLRPHEHTSYLSLGLMLLATGVALSGYTATAADHPAPVASSVSLTGSMPSKPPTVAATIKAPANDQRFSSTPITVSGTCPIDTVVEVFKENIFAGSTPCETSGTYSLETDLLYGKNDLVARVYDALNQAGPDSNIVTVHYDVLPAQSSGLSPLNFGGSQLILNTNAVYRGTFPGQELNVPIDMIGGRPPFALNVQWGDSTNKVVPRNDNQTFRIGHTYSKPGVYQISLQATDADGRVAFLTFAAIVNGQTTATGSTGGMSSTDVNRLLVLWPVYVAAVAIVGSFMLGEVREKRMLRSRGLLINP